MTLKMDSLKLVFSIENPKHIGGGGYSIFKFAQNVAALGHDVTIFAKNDNGVFEGNELPATLKVHFRGALKRYFKGCEFINRVYGKIYQKIIINRFLKKNPDVDYVIGFLRDSAINAIKIGKSTNIKVANFVFECPPWMEKDLGDRWFEEYQGSFKKSWQDTKKAYIDSDVLISNSKISKRECESWIGKDVKGFVYPGIDLYKADKVKGKKKNQIIYVGRINPYKNLDTLLMALKRIPNPPKLVIGGDGQDRERIEKLANDLNLDVDFLGNITDDEKFRQMKSSRFMVFPSSHEGFGMPPMEALYCGIPCLCSDKPIFKEVYGNNIYYFKEQDVEDLAKKISSLLKNPPSKAKITKSRNYVSSKLSWEKSAKKIVRLLR